MDINPEKRKDLGRRVEVYWDEDTRYYAGTVVGYHAARRTHIILYDDGDKERLCLDEVPHRWLDEQQPPQSHVDALAGVQPLTESLPAMQVAQPAPAPQPRKQQMGMYSRSDDDNSGQEEEEEGGRRTSQEGGGGSGRSMLGEAAYGGLPPKKRQRLMGNAGSGSMLPPLRALENGQGSGRAQRSSNGAAAAGSGPSALFGCDMESLLQAVESELGDRSQAGADALAAAAALVAEEEEQERPPSPPQGGWEPQVGASGRSGPRGGPMGMHQYHPNGTIRSPRGQMGPFRSPARRSNMQHQHAWQQGYGPHHPPPHMLPGMQHSYGHMPPPQFHPHDMNGWGHPPQHMMPQQAHFSGRMPPPGAMPPPPGPMGPPGPEFSQVNIIEDLLGIKISSFTVPLFTAPPNGHRLPRLQQMHGPPGCMPLANGGVHPHLQRTPITTGPPCGSGPLPPLSTAASGPADPRRMGGEGVQGVQGAPRNQSVAHNVIVSSPFLASLAGAAGPMPGMPALPGFSPLPMGLNLFKGGPGPGRDGPQSVHPALLGRVPS